MDVWKAEIQSVSRHGSFMLSPIVRATRRMVEDELRSDGFKRCGHWTKGIWTSGSMTAVVSVAAQGI